MTPSCAGDPLKLQRAAAQYPSQLPLAPYLEYWRLKLRLEDTPDADVLAFLGRLPGTYLAERLRADWLRQLGKRRDWTSFERELSPLQQDDLEIRCYAWLARVERGDTGAVDEARALWLEPREWPEGCGALADRLLGEGRISVDEVWRRVRVLFENGQLSAAARRALATLPAGEKHDERTRTRRRPRPRPSSPRCRAAWTSAPRAR